MNITLTDKIIFITGGTGALGSSLVEECQREGAQVYFTFCHNQKKARELERCGAHSLLLDLRDKESIRTGVQYLFEKLPRIDALINNAVMVLDKTLVQMTSDMWDEVFQVGLVGPRMLTELCMPLIEKSAHPKIINIISRTATYGAFGQANYAAAKAELISLTKEWAWAWGSKGIIVNGVNPGFMISDITQQVSEELKDYHRFISCLHRFSEPHDVARFICYMLSDMFGAISGQIFDCDTRIR